MTTPAATRTPPLQGKLLVYRTEDGRLKIDVRIKNDSIWLPQQHMAALFQITNQNLSLHLQTIFRAKELQENSVVKDSLTTAADGKGYQQKHHKLDAIISVGYRVKSIMATRFRIWTTQKLPEYIVKGFALDDVRLKNPDEPFDYLEEQRRRIQEIHTSERNFYPKITDNYATSNDNDPTQTERIEGRLATVATDLHERIWQEVAA